jgi:hypothetical protein
VFLLQHLVRFSLKLKVDFQFRSQTLMQALDG